MVSLMESKPSSLSPQASFVSCLSCHYCDCVSFDETDVNTYASHLKEAHRITRNVESLVALTLKEQQIKPEVVTPPTAVVQPPVFKLPTTEMTMDWMDDDVGGAMEDEETEEEKNESMDEKSNVPASSDVSATETITNDSVKDDVVPVDKKENSSSKEDSVAVEEKEPPPSNEPKAKMEKPKRKDKKKRNDSEKAENKSNDGPIVKGKMMGTVEHSPEVQKLLDGEKSKAGVGYLEQKAAEKKEKEKKAAELKAQKKAAEKLAAEQKLAEKKLAEEKKAAEEALKEFEKKEKKKMEAEKKAQADKKAEADRKAKAEAEKKVEAEKKAQAEKKMEAKKKADGEKKTKSEKKIEQKEPVAEKKSDIDAIMDEWLNESELDGPSEPKVDPKPKPATILPAAAKPKVVQAKVSPKSDIDAIMDDWLNASELDCADDSIPDELPEIDEVTEKKKRSTKKTLDSVMPSMDRLTNIMDDAGNKNVKNSVDDWFKGTKMTVPNTAYSLPKEEKVVEDKKKESLPTGDCVVCGQMAKALCSGCKHIFYCSREHQKKHWSLHKEECKGMARLPWRVERSETLGRFLVATKEVEEGELILNESPMVVGPRQLTKPVCLGCHKEITPTTPWKPCVRCHWPVCSPACQDSPAHDAECRATKAAGSRVKVEHFGQINMMYACITVLRALGLKEGPRKIWEDYTKFDSHLEERMKTPVYNKVNKEKYLNIQRYSDLEILEACGKLDTNCFEIKQNGLNLRAMYRTACIMSHNCRPNTRHTFDPDNSINIYSTRRIKKGDMISATYTNSLWSTNDRREHLKMSKCFWCECERCSDPTEFGSYMSATRCSRCSPDLQHLVSEDPLNSEANYTCEKCSNSQRASQIRTGNMTIANELKELNRAKLENLMGFLSQYEPILGPTNAHVVEIKYAVVMLLANRKPYVLENLTQEQLELKASLAEQLLQLATMVEPGSSRWRGQLLLELQVAQMSLAAGLEEAGTIGRVAAKERAEEAMSNLQESARILQVEPDMKEVVQGRLAAVSTLLAKWEE